jgi:Polysaccharide lyase
MNDLASPSPRRAGCAALALATACLVLPAIGCRQHVLLGGLPDGAGQQDGSGVLDAGRAADGAEIGDRSDVGDAGGPDVANGADRPDGASTLLWKATFEPGDLSEWTSDGAGGSIFENIATAPAVTTTVAHGGRYSAKATVMPAVGMASSNYLYRVAPSPTEAYYGAWYYIPSTVVSVRNYLSLIHIDASRTGDGQNAYARWDLNVYSSPVASGSGNLVAHLYDYALIANREQLVPITVPRDTWVHFEVLMVKSATTTGRMAVWQDDVLIIDDPGVVTTPNDWVQWRFGGASDMIDPSPSAVYVDDVTISTTRLGSTAVP